MATDQDIRDALNLLAERAPKTCPVPGDGSLGIARPVASRRPWGLIVAAAAIVLLVAGIVTYAVGGHSGSGNGPAAHSKGSRLTCASTPEQDPAADHDALGNRLAELGGTDIRITAMGAKIQADVRGLSSDLVQRVCATGRLDLRGVVAPPVPVSCRPQVGSPCSATSVPDAAKAGGFTVPVDDTGYQRLTSAQQDLITAALADFDCSTAAAGNQIVASYLVACVTGSAGPTGSNAVLLGPAIVGRTQIDKAIAVPPDAQQGMTEWAVAITLSDGGTAWWARYTTAHHTGGDSNVAGVDQCGATGTPCADYVGVTVDGRVISVPVNIEAITGGTTQIAGNFTEVSAKALAASIQSGPLPVPLRAATMQSLP